MVSIIPRQRHRGRGVIAHITALFVRDTHRPFAQEAAELVLLTCPLQGFHLSESSQ